MPSSNPYPGLLTFDSSEKFAFFGRDLEARQVTGMCLSARVSVLFGETGSGKSSLISAGVLAFFNDAKSSATSTMPRRSNPLDSYDPDRRVLPVHYRQWGPGKATESIVRALDCRTGGGSEDTSTESVNNLHQALRRTTSKQLTVLLILDQFEEYFSLPRDTAFEDALVEIANDCDVDVRILFVLRDDGLSHLERLKNDLPGLFDNLYQLKHLSIKSAIEAIHAPLQRTAADPPFTVEDHKGLIDSLTAAHRRRTSLYSSAELAEAVVDTELRVEAPLLQIVMHRLWEIAAARPDHVLRLSDLGKRAPVQDALKQHVQDQLKLLPDNKSRDVAAGILPSLILDSGQKVRRSEAEICSYVERGGETDRRGESTDVLVVLRRLAAVDIRLLQSAAGDPNLAETEHKKDIFYSLYHDVLGPPLREWSNARRADLRKRRRIFKYTATGVSAMAIAAFVAFAVTFWYASQNTNERLLAAQRRAAALSSALLHEDTSLALRLAKLAHGEAQRPDTGAIAFTQNSDTKDLLAQTDKHIRSVASRAPAEVLDGFSEFESIFSQQGKLRRIVKQKSDDPKKPKPWELQTWEGGANWSTKEMPQLSFSRSHVLVANGAQDVVITIDPQTGKAQLIRLPNQSQFGPSLDLKSMGGDVRKKGSAASPVEPVRRVTTAALCPLQERSLLVLGTDNSMYWAFFVPDTGNEIRYLAHGSLPRLDFDSNATRDSAAPATVRAIGCGMDATKTRWTITFGDAYGRIFIFDLPAPDAKPRGDVVELRRIAGLGPDGKVTSTFRPNAVTGLLHFDSHLVAAHADGKLLGLTLDASQNSLGGTLIHQAASSISTMIKVRDDAVAYGTSAGNIEVLRLQNLKKDPSSWRTARLLQRSAHDGAVVSLAALSDFTNAPAAKQSSNSADESVPFFGVSIVSHGIDDRTKVWSVPPINFRWINDVSFSTVPALAKAPAAGALVVAQGKTVTVFKHSELGALTRVCSWDLPKIEVDPQKTGGVDRKERQVKENEKNDRENHVYRLNSSADGIWFAAASVFGTVYKIKRESCDEEARVSLAPSKDAKLRSLAISHDDKFVAVGFDDGTVRTIRTAEWQPEPKSPSERLWVKQLSGIARQPPCPSNPIRALAFSRDNKWLFAGSYAGRLFVVGAGASASSGARLYHLIRNSDGTRTLHRADGVCDGNPSGVSPLAILSLAALGKNQLAVGAGIVTMAEFEPESGEFSELTTELQAAPSTRIHRISVSSDSKVVGIAGGPSFAALLRLRASATNDPAQADLLGMLSSDADVESIAVHPDGKLVAWGGQDGVLRVAPNIGFGEIPPSLMRKLTEDECKTFGVTADECGTKTTSTQPRSAPR